MTTKKVIILDDEPAMVSSLKRELRSRNQDYKVSGFTSFKDALLELAKGDCYAFITDVKMPTLTGDQIVHYISQKYPDQKCIVITGQASIEQQRRIAQAGNTVAIVAKPINIDSLQEALDKIGIDEETHEENAETAGAENEATESQEDDEPTGAMPSDGPVEYIFKVE